MNTPAPMYYLATLKIRAGKMEEFCTVMPRAIVIMERHGWQLIGSWGHMVGRLNAVTDLWRVTEANAVPAGFAGLMQHQDWPEIGAALASCVEDEVSQLLTRMPFDPGRV